MNSKLVIRSPVSKAHVVASRVAQPVRRRTIAKGIELDWSDPDTILGALGAASGLLLGIGAPIFYTQRVEKDEKDLEELRELNRQNFKQTGEYLTPV